MIGATITTALTGDMELVVVDRYSEAIASGTNQYVNYDMYLASDKEGKVKHVHPRDVTSVKNLRAV